MADARCALGMLYQHGIGTTPSSSLAFSLYTRTQAAERGDLYAYCYLGDCCRDGVGVARDSRQAFIWYKRSAEQGNPQGQYSLAKCYENGVGVEPDPKRMMELFRAAAEQGHELAGEYLGLYHSDLR